MHFEDSVKEFNGEQIFCRHLAVDGKVDTKAVIFICHGFGEHVGRYDELFELFNSLDFYVFSHDHVGHGKSSGYRAWVPDYNVFTIPVKQHIEETQKKFPGKKLFIYGHSMGGLIALKALQENKNLADGAILEGPFLGVPDFLPGFIVSIGIFLGRYRLTHALPVSKIDSKLISHNKDLVKSYDTDPLVYHGAANARFVASSMDAKDSVFANAENVELPILVCHGTGDQICPFSATERLFNSCSSKDKVLKAYDGAYHVLRDEPYNNTTEKFLKDVTDWLKTHC